MSQAARSSRAPVQVAITGAAGQVCYTLLFRIASGQLFGPETPVAFRLLEIEPALPALNGVVMELQDCAFPLLADVVTTADPAVAFKGASWALLVGARPRTPDMKTRRELLEANGKIFGPQGRAIAENAASDVRILVVGNPCNTNCLIARAHAPEIPDDRWFAMTRLDENRARAQLAIKAGVPVAEVKRMAIWGNHSATQFPDAWNTTIAGRPAPEVIGDDAWLRGAFVERIQNRGNEILAARGASSAGSAANAIMDSVRAIHSGTPADDVTSLAVVSHGEYGAAEGLIVSYPITSSGGGSWRVVEGVQHDAEAQKRVTASFAELAEERRQVTESGLLPA